MRKRSRYKPRPMLANPVAFVCESVKPLAQHADHLIELKIKHHAAMAELTQGRAVRSDLDSLIAMSNMTEAMCRLGFGQAYRAIATAGQHALLAVCSRGAASGRFILRAEEMSALNDLLELHDAQMDIATVGDIDRALKLIERERRAGRMERIDNHTTERTV